MSPVTPTNNKKKAIFFTSNPKKKWFDLNNISLILILWDALFGIPASFFLAKANKSFFTWMGYEKLMRCPGGILGNRILFVGINTLLVVAWAAQLVKEDRKMCVEGEIKWWDERIAWLEGEMARVCGIEALEAEEQLKSGIKESLELENEKLGSIKEEQKSTAREHSKTGVKKAEVIAVLGSGGQDKDIARRSVTPRKSRSVALKK